MVLRLLVSASLGLVLLLVLPTGAFAQAVLQSVSVQVKPGKMPVYLDRVGKLQGVLDRAGSGGRVQVWQATLAGTGTGTALVAVSFPSLGAFAESTSKVNADPEWQKIVAGLGGIRTLVSQSLLVSQDGGGQPEPSAAGSVMQGVLVRVKPGKMDAYLKRIETLKKVQERVGATSNLRVWQATLAGDATGTVAIGIIHPSLGAYAENTAKVQADPEWQKLFGNLDQLRTLVSSSLFVGQ